MSFTVSLPNGAVSVSTAWAEGTSPGTIMVAHGAGAGMEHPFLVGFTDALNALGFSTLRFNFPYREQGRRMPGPADHAVMTWRAAAAAVRARSAGPVWAVGKSYGGRMASMAVAEGLVVDGLIYLGYPLHAPGKPEKPRADHLPMITAPQLFISGTNDPFIQPLSQLEEVIATCQNALVEWIDDGGHSFEVRGRKREPEAIGASLAPLVEHFVSSLAR